MRKNHMLMLLKLLITIIAIGYIISLRNKNTLAQEQKREADAARMPDTKAQDESDSWSKMQAREITIQAFVDTMGETVLYYSTPWGDGPDGKPQLYILSSKASEDGYYPAFLSEEHCTQFFTSSGRAGFLIMQGTLVGLLSLLDVDPMLAKLGVIIEPGFPDTMTIPPGIRAGNPTPESQ